MNRLKAATLMFIKLAAVWLLSILLLSSYELILNGLTHELPKQWPEILLWSWIGDLLFWLDWLIVSYLVFVILYLIYPKLADWLFTIFIVLMLLLHVVLIHYFNTSLVPLGADIYGYSLADITQTVGASGGVNVFTIGLIIGLVVMVLAALRRLPGRIRIPLWLAAVFLAFSMAIAFSGGSSRLTQPHSSSDLANNLILNKSAYFFSGSYVYFFSGDQEVDIYSDAYIGDYFSSSDKSVQFVYPDASQYPFLHRDNTPDVLAPFLNKATTKPNIVIILVEGLGRAFTNDDAYLGNFTPFIDSLSKKSLYWKNFLSQGGRTFAVLPSLIGSLPFGKNGFLELGSDMPKHLSLYSILKNAGYSTSFNYGGDASFDNMRLFLQINAVDRVQDLKSFAAGYARMPSLNGFTWGYGDKELYRHYLASTAAQTNGSAKLDVILTVSTHSPFLINGQEAYLDRFEQRMTALEFEDPKKDTYRNYKFQYSSILYADDALRNFFQAYKKKPEYNNTIFLITGDHRMPEIPMSSKIDRYHVPLIIYSPLLKRNAVFNSVSSHFDIAPSLVSYLKHNYALPAPAYANWMGNGLDTARNFRNIHAYPLIQTKTETVDFVMGEYHLNGNVLYKMGADLREVPVKDEVMLKQLIGAFDAFKQRNAKLIDIKKLVPDSIYNKYLQIGR